VEPVLGNLVWDWQEALAQHSDPGYAEKGPAHGHLPDRRAPRLRPAHQPDARCGFDEVDVDAVGNVVGRYHGRPTERQIHC
jgi:N-carbamoyl-L-amino-acid hydrolase